MSSLQAGDQRAILVDCAFTQSKKKGTLGIVLSFNCLDNDNKAFAQTKVTRWVTDNTGDYVMKDLIRCGLKDGVKDVAVLAEEDAINKYFDQTVVSLNLEYESYEGKEYLRVQYINTEGGSSFEKLSITETKKTAKGLDLKGMLAKVRTELGPLPKIESTEAADEVPFGDKKKA